MCLIPDRVLMTPFRTMVVPPPMSAFYLQMAAPVTQVAFCHSPESSNDIAVLLCTGLLVIYAMTTGKVLQVFATLTMSYSVSRPRAGSGHNVPLLVYIISYASPLILFSSLFPYLSSPLLIFSLDPRRFQARCHKNLACRKVCRYCM